jgi:hypothetical protein
LRADIVTESSVVLQVSLSMGWKVDGARHLHTVARAQVVLALFDNDRLHAVAQRPDYLERSAGILRATVEPSLPHSSNLIDKCANLPRPPPPSLPPSPSSSLFHFPMAFVCLRILQSHASYLMSCVRKKALNAEHAAHPWGMMTWAYRPGSPSHCCVPYQGDSLVLHRRRARLPARRDREGFRDLPPRAQLVL